MLGNKKKDLNKKLFPLRRFSEIGLYDLTYLSLLIQRGKLNAQKVGRNYFTTIEWFEEYLKNHSRNKNIDFDKNIVLKKSEKLVLKKNKSESLSKGEISGLNGFLDNVLIEDESSNKINNNTNQEPVLIPKIKGSENQAEKNLKIIKRRNGIIYKTFKFLQKSIINFKNGLLYILFQIFNFSKEFVKTFFQYCFNLIKLSIAFPFMLIGSFLFVVVGVVVGTIYQTFRKLYEVPGKLLVVCKRIYY